MAFPGSASDGYFVLHDEITAHPIERRQWGFG